MVRLYSILTCTHDTFFHLFYLRLFFTLYVHTQKLPARLEREVRRSDRAIAAISETGHVYCDAHGRLSKKRRVRPQVGGVVNSDSAEASSVTIPRDVTVASSEGKHKAPHHTPEASCLVEPWTTDEHDCFLEGIKKHGVKWGVVAAYIPTRTVEQITSYASQHCETVKDALKTVQTHRSTAGAKRTASAHAGGLAPRHVGGQSAFRFSGANAAMDTLALAARGEGVLLSVVHFTAVLYVTHPPAFSCCTRSTTHQIRVGQ
jgi:hypothetical protein